MKMSRVRALYGRPANRTAMIEAIQQLDSPRFSGLLFIPDSILARQAPDEFVQQIHDAMTDPLVLPPPSEAMPRIIIGGKEQR